MTRVLHGAAVDAVFLVIVTLWWTPTILAVWRRHPRVPLVATLNFLLMWPVALIYVAAEPSHRKDQVRPADPVGNWPADSPTTADPKVTPMRRRGRWQ